MKKNTLFVSVLVGLGSVMALFTVLTENGSPQFTPRNSAENGAHGEANFEYFEIMRKNAQTGKVEAGDYLNAIAQTKSNRNARATQLNWEFSGPDNIGGRARAIVVDNANGNKLYAGGAGGGMYVSTDGAGSWTYKSSDWDNIHVSTIAQDKDGRIYAGTGMYADAGAPSGGSFPGGGIYVSDDRGETWSHLASTLPAPYTPNDTWAYVNRIAVAHSKNAQGNYTVYAATRNGLKVSLDKGQTWIEPMTLPNCVNVLPGNVQDVVTTSTGRVLVSYNGGLYISDDGETTCSYNNVGAANGIGGSTRMSLAVCSSDENIVYAFQGFSGNPATFQILKSSDAGDNWAPLQPAPPTTVIDSTFDLMGSNPASYNQAIGVDPNNCDKIYVGAVQLYQVAGSWNSVATTFNLPGYYVHADVHWFTFDPSNPNNLYVGTDGGVAKSSNAASSNINWTENNRHFGTTQYYGIATSTGGQILGGTQDNGTHLINPSLGGPAAKDGLEVFGGDGFDCEISAIGDVAFVTSQYGAVGRGSYQGGGSQGGIIHPSGRPGSGNPASPFYTVMRAWESKNDVTSKDSVVFTNDTARFSIGTGDGNKKLYTGTLRKLQESAKIVPGQVKFEDIAGGQVATDSDVLGVLKSFGDSVGTVDYNTGEYSIRWSFAPPVGSAVNSVFNVKYNAGDTIVLVSQNQGVNFPYELTSGLVTNDSVKVQDPVQSLVVVSMNGGFDITREALYFPLQIPTWTTVSSTTPSCFEFSKDGNHLYVGGYNGRVTRISGLNNFYSGDDPNAVLTKTDIFNGASAVSGICIHPTDPEKLLVTTAGYGLPTHVYELTAAESATGFSPNRNLQGDLPDFPVYDPEYNVNKPEQVVLGTELGVWYSEDVSGVSPTWTQQSNGVGNVPVMDVRQQRLPHNEALNYGRFYIGTFGRGIWTSGDLVSVGDNDSWADFNDNKEISNVKLYPNPVNMVSKLTFDMPANGSVNVMIYDISGKVIRNEKKNFAKGNVSYEINSVDMPAGTYFVSLRSGEFVKQAKFVVVK
ncbi:T9SS type A sorting domain-containing protein [bacterium SCSIO 12643]|nr:T9SS type A sorting domain-containing protein [bacterium SCSIO 12643]